MRKKEEDVCPGYRAASTFYARDFDTKWKIEREKRRGTVGGKNEEEACPGYRAASMFYARDFDTK